MFSDIVFLSYIFSPLLLVGKQHTNGFYLSALPNELKSDVGWFGDSQFKFALERLEKAVLRVTFPFTSSLRIGRIGLPRIVEPVDWTATSIVFLTGYGITIKCWRWRYCRVLKLEMLYYQEMRDRMQRYLQYSNLSVFIAGERQASKLRLCYGAKPSSDCI